MLRDPFHFPAFLFVLLLALSPVLVEAQVQKEALAQEYFKRGEFDKALSIYQELREQQPESAIIYRYYYQSQLALQNYEELDKELRKIIKKNPDQLHYRVDLGHVYDLQGNPSGAKQQFEEAIKALPPNRAQIVQLSNSFSAIEQYDYAIRSLESGAKLLRGLEPPFHYELANLYFRQGDVPSMIRSLLDDLQSDARNMGTVQATLQRNLSDSKHYEELQTQLYTRIQRQPNEDQWNELLIWNFIQNKDFEAAFQQVRALDRRLREPGQRVHNFAVLAQAEQEWDVAVQAYQYLVDKGRENPYYFSARNGVIESRQQKLLKGYGYTEQDLQALAADYRQFIREYNRRDARNAEATRKLASIHALYLHQLDTAIALMEGLMSTAGLRASELGAAKLDLGDYLLMSGDIWESTLLYSQVDKSMKDEPMGERARFLNARLSYFSGDFDWAQAQLEVLKAATSELVANDALHLSVFISSNLGLDTTTEAMRRYSRAELLVYQNRFEQANLVLDSLSERFPGHALSDDVLWMKSGMAMSRNQLEEAATLLEELCAKHADGILIDDALYTLGKLYQERLNQPEKAMAAFERLLMEHKDSVFTSDARKQFRALRGDMIN